MRVVLIDDDKMILTSLKIILEASGEVAVAAVGSDGEAAAALYEIHRPDIMIMDIRMKKVSGLEAAEQILAKDPQALILLLTTFADDEYIVKALHIGVKGYLLKQDFESILPALRAVKSGQSVIGGEISSRIPKLLAVKSTVSNEQDKVSEKEWKIVQLVAEGLSNKEIAARLFLSEGTVRNYLSIILEKLNLRDRTQLAVFYFRTRQDS